MALLEVFPDRVKLKVTLMSLMGGDSLDAQPTDVTEVAPARGRFGIQGVAFRVKDGGRFFFWTKKGRELLRLLAVRGFPMSSELRSESKW